MPIPTYVAPFTTRGSVRGTCGHDHTTRAAAEQCVDADRRACRSQGGRTDRRIYDATGALVSGHLFAPGTERA